MELKRLIVQHVAGHTALLIVPYGIETRDNPLAEIFCQPFNRTLWN